ncbi:MAG: YbjQ family protein [Planctomycetales bacterium]
MLVTTTLDIEGYCIVEYLGVVRGIVVRSPTIAQGFFGNLKSIIGGHISSFTEMCEQARQHAYEEMLQHAAELGADAIVGMRYDASEVGSKAVMATEVLCYGTAVRIQRV